MAEVKRRTFGAKRYPKGSPERARLNEDVLTSEYMPSYRYCVPNGRSTRSFRTKAEAEAHAQEVSA